MSLLPLNKFFFFFFFFLPYMIVRQWLDFEEGKGIDVFYLSDRVCV